MVQTSLSTASAPPAPTMLRVRPGGALAHIFTTGPGWTRSRCGEVLWSAALREPADHMPTCTGCSQVEQALAVQGTGL